jgi:hypothetical protein
MRSLFGRRPSPAMVVALLALMVAFSGSAVADDVVRAAKEKLSGSRLKPRSVSGDRIRRNSLTGVEIAESRLRKVPLAARADVVTLADRASIADSAVDADRVDGVSVLPIKYDTLAPGDFPQTIFDRAGLRLTANCAGHQLSLTATAGATGGNDNSIAVTAMESTAPATAGSGEDPDFDAGETFDLAAAMGAGDGDGVLGRLIYNGSYAWTISADLWLDETAAGCRIYGVVMSAL